MKSNPITTIYATVIVAVGIGLLALSNANAKHTTGFNILDDPTVYGNNGATTQPLDLRPRCPAANLDDMAGWHDYDFEGRAGEDLTLEYTVFDIDGWDTAKWLINGDCIFENILENIAVTADGGTESRTVTIPGSTLVTGTNTLSFVQEPAGYELKVSDVKVANNDLDDTNLLDLFHSALEDCTTALANSGSTCTLCSDLEVDILDAACDVLQVKPATSTPAFIAVITALSNAVLNNAEICDPETAASCLTLILDNLPMP